MNGIKCAECGHQNDLTRAFCQNCGARLERTSAVDPKDAGKERVVSGTRGRGRVARPGIAAGLFHFIRRIIFTAILAAILAAIIQMARAPDGVPPAQPADEAQAGRLLQMLQTFAESTYARSIDVTQEQANNYLASSIVPDPAATGKLLQADFGRAFVIIKPGQLDFLVEQRFHGWPIYLSLVTMPEISAGKMTLKTIGGAIGRMPLSARLVPLLKTVLRPVIASTSEAVAVLETANEVVLAPPSAKLSWHARKPVPR